MNLTDIEKAVAELSFRHPGLTKEFLRTLLEASGWEEKNIKEAQIIYAAHMATAFTRISKEQGISQAEFSDAVVFPSKTERAEEDLSVDVSLKTKYSDLGEGVVISDTGDAVKENENPLVPNLSKPKEKDIEVLAQKKGSGHHLISSTEEQSLIKEDYSNREQKSKAWSELPENLPLVPFESSPHVWSFGRYKDTFYQEPKAEEKENKTTITAMSYELEKKQELVSSLNIEPTVIHQAPTDPQPVLQKNGTDIEADFEKTPISKGEESLVVLASIMLLAIMLLLGYMYGNGRL